MLEIKEKLLDWDSSPQSAIACSSGGDEYVEVCDADAAMVYGPEMQSVRRACRFTNNVGPAAGSPAAVLVQRASPTRTLSTTLQERRKHLPSLPGNRQLVADGDLLRGLLRADGAELERAKARLA